MTEAQAQQAFNAARTQLDAAMLQYDRARQELYRITGDFHGADTAAMRRQFTQVGTAQGLGGDAATVKADC